MSTQVIGLVLIVVGALLWALVEQGPIVGGLLIGFGLHQLIWSRR